MSAKRGPEHIIELGAKRAHLGDVNPGKEYVEPRIYQQPVLDYDGHHQVAGPVQAATSTTVLLTTIFTLLSRGPISSGGLSPRSR